MRYINIRKLRLPEGWEDNATKALEKVSVLPPNKRRAAINRKARIWQSLTQYLEELSYSKCWYCETRQERSDNCVDHFRPKNRVIERKDHPGYWWLAFDWKNYRFCCTYCNSRRVDEKQQRGSGKHDSFPVIDERYRACTPCGDINCENPCLLDPTVATDPGLLWFNRYGIAVPRHAEAQSSESSLRATLSIAAYNLNYFKTVERRRFVYNCIEVLVNDGELYMMALESGDIHAKRGMERVLASLCDMISPEAEFSAAARSYLYEFKSRDWIEEVLRIC